MSEAAKKEVSYEGQVELAKAIAYLESVVSGLKAGTVSVQQGDDFLTVKPTSSVKFAVEARRKKDKESLAFELKWETPQPETGSDQDLQILDRELVSAFDADHVE